MIGSGGTARLRSAAGRCAPTTLAAAGWALVSVRLARRRLRTHGVGARIPPPPPLPVTATRGVMAVMRRLNPTCLERATVVQTWLAAHDTPVDVVVGVAPRNGSLAAHAWVDDGTLDDETTGYREIYRIPAPAVRRRGRRPVRRVAVARGCSNGPTG